MLALIELSAQRWHLVELVVAVLQPALVLLLCLGFVLASAHLITMLGTRWGDRGTSSKALFFSLAVHASFALGIIALIPEYRQRIFFAASRDHEHFAQVMTQPEPGGPSPVRPGGNQPVWDRVASSASSVTTRAAVELTRPEPAAPPERTTSDLAMLAPRDSLSVPLPAAAQPTVPTTSIEAASIAKPAIALPTESVTAEARPEYKPPNALSREPLAGVQAGTGLEMQRPEPRNDSTPARPAPDFDPSQDLASLGPTGGAPRPVAPVPTASDVPGRQPGSSASPAPAALLETTENGVAAPQRNPGPATPAVSPSIARLGMGGAGRTAGPGGSSSGTGGDSPERFRSAGEPGGTGDRPRRGDGGLARIDGLPSLTPSAPALRLDPLSPASAGTGKTPAAYQLRTKDQRDKAVAEFGGSDASEAAVDLSLKFLASAQHPDGYWDAEDHGAGKTKIDEEGIDRQNVGRDADVGVTALAVLSYLGKMNTTEQGPHRDTVTRGLRWLAAGQRGDGFLGRNASEYCAMYCHGMATFALAEAYALSEDKQANAWLRGPLAKAVQYTLDSQLADGGWRYLKGQPDGDMSMFGWQLMSLRSAEAAGVAIPSDAKTRMIQFLQSRSVGKQGGLAAYRQGDQVTPAMTAEALFCKQMLGMRRTNPACQEAIGLLSTSLPNREKYNLYYWYYGTLAMFQHGGESWGQWNGAMRDILVSEQLKTGLNAGSWEPRDRWGGSGGRIYSTAMATMCLEVYYRYLPLYQGVPTQPPVRGPAPVEQSRIDTPNAAER